MDTEKGNTADFDAVYTENGKDAGESVSEKNESTSCGECERENGKKSPEAPAEREKCEKCCDAAEDGEMNCSASKKQSKPCKGKKEREQHALEIQAMQKKLDELNDRYCRVLAEYDNFRKRTQKEKDAIYGDAKTQVISKLLPVIDNFERAALSGEDFAGYKKGIEMTVSQLLDTVSAMGVESFGEKGEPFDANIHNAVMHEEDEALPENSISDVFQKGYRLGERILRCATVKVVN